MQAPQFIEGSLTLFDKEDEGKLGCTSFMPNGEVIVNLSADLTLAGMLDILAHELAHVVCGYSETNSESYEKGHDAAWQTTYDNIFVEYNKIVSEHIEQSGGDAQIARVKE